MSRLRGLLFRLRSIVSRDAAEAELDDEVQFHIDMQTRKYVERGVPPDQARALAWRDFGSTASVKDTARDTWGGRLIAEVTQDVRYAARSLRRQPVYALTAILTFGVGVGANMSVFSLLDATLLRPLPFPAADRLMAVPMRMPTDGGLVDMAWSYPKYELLARQQTAFEALGLYSLDHVTLSLPDGVERLDVESVSSGYFRTLGIAAALGTVLGPEDDGPGTPHRVVLSHDFWVRAMAGDTAAVGRSITINGLSLQVAGVMPPTFRGLTAVAEVWLPLAATRFPANFTDPGSHNLRLIARRRQGVTAMQAAAVMSTIGQRVDAAFPDSRRGHWSANAYPLDDLRADPTLRWSVIALSASVVLVLLIACVNITSLILARAAARRRELAVRVALGADVGRLARQMLTETLLLAGGGMLVAAGIGAVIIRGLSAAAPFTGSASDLSPMVLSLIHLDARALTVATAVALLSGVLVGLVPALLSARTPAIDAMRIGAASPPVFSGLRRLTGRGMLVIAEVALAVVLLVSAALTLRSLRETLNVRFGFDVDRVVSLRVRMTGRGPYDRDARAVIWKQIAARMAGVPGATSAAVGLCAPVGHLCEGRQITIAGDRSDQHVSYHPASSGYFEALGIAVLRGRVFTPDEDRVAPNAVVINAAAARQLWRGRDPFKHPILGDSGQQIPVIGIVADARYEDMQAAPQPAMYVPLARAFNGRGAIGAVVFVRTSGDPAAIVSSLRREIRALDPTYAISDVHTLRQALSEATSRSRFTTVLLTSFAVVALCLAALGIYGVLAIAVTQRTREMGIRMAIGAESWRVVRLVVVQASGMVGIGGAIGLVGALGASRAIRSLLYGVTPLDPVSYFGSAAVLVGIGIAAAAVPALRAGRVSPTEALRAEH